MTARLTGNRLLGLPGAAKEVRRFTFDTGECERPFAYEAGDALGVTPVNSPGLVAEWLAVTGLDANTAVPVPAGPASAPGTGHDPRPPGSRPANCRSARPSTATSTSPASPRPCCASSPTAPATAACKTLLRPDNKDELAQWCWGRQAVDVVAEYPVRATRPGVGRRAQARSSRGCTPSRPAR